MLGRIAGALMGLAAITLLAGAAGTVSGCSVLCSEKREVVEVEYGSPWYEVQNTLLDRYRETGYDCTGESIRNAFGATIGMKYTCTKCG